MKSKRIFFIVFCALVLLAFGFFFFSGGRLMESEDLAAHPKIFFEKSDFWKGVQHDDLFSVAIPIAGGVVPHHLIPSDALASFFKGLQKQNPSTIILFAPNHFQVGRADLITSPLTYHSPFGDVQVDLNLYQKMLDSGLVESDDLPFAEEHGIGNLIPFIRYYLPDTKIVPVIFMPNTTMRKSEQFSQLLKSLLSDDVVLLASIDFSHYLIAQQAEEKDAVTWDLISHWKLSEIRNLNNNDYLDTPPALVTLMRTMQLFGAEHIEKYYHNNSGFLWKDLKMPTTSYFVLGFRG